jgi:hypothetical protein
MQGTSMVKRVVAAVRPALRSTVLLARRVRVVLVLPSIRGTRRPGVLRTAELCALTIGMLTILPGSALGSEPASVRVGAKPLIPSGAHPIGALAGSIPVQATVTLQARNPAALAAYAQAVSTPGSSQYHHFLTVAEFARRFGPTLRQVNAVQDALRAEGLSPGKASANRLSFSVTAPAAKLSSAFSISFDRFRLADGRAAYANTAAPSVAANIAGVIQGVLGLSTLAVPRPLGLRRSASFRPAASSSASTTLASPPAPCPPASTQASADSSYTANQIASAYGLTSLYGNSDYGSGTTVALYELEPYGSSDIAAYQSCYGTSASVTNVSVDGGAGTGSGQGEAALDIEDVAGLAPQANIRVYEGPNTNSGAYDTYSQIVTDNTAQVVSTSWGLCESQAGSTAASAENTLFQEAATQGQSIFAAAGDNGTADCTDTNGNPIAQPAVDDPASQPYVTGVGGTSLTSVGPPPTETVWNDGMGSGAGGGGVSTFWTRPTYQTGFAISQSSVTCSSSNTCREVPDVSANADEQHGYVIYYGGGWTSFGGTSVAAPTWAALTALADASSVCAGSRVGFANSALYTAAVHGYSGNFHDVTSGNNSYDGVSGFSAGSGYDMASGLGTPSAPSLAPALCGDLVSVAAPGSQSTPAGAQASLQLSATSSAGTPVTYGASNLPLGLAVNSSTGVISGMPSTPGTWRVTADATDTSGSVGDASFTWVINSSGTTTSSPVVPPPSSKVTITQPGSQTGRVATPESVLVYATDSRGLRLSYRASGLPPGLSINSGSGLVSGTPRQAGRSTPTVTATDSAGGSASATFSWVIAGRPALISKSLKLVHGRKPRLLLKLRAGTDAAAIKSITLQPRSAAIRFSTNHHSIARGIVVSAGQRLKLVGRGRRGSLTITVSRAAGARSLSLRIDVPEISLSRSLMAMIGAHRRSAAKLTLVVKDAQGVATSLTISVSP